MEGLVAEFMCASFNTNRSSMHVDYQYGQLMLVRLEQRGRGLYRQVGCLVAGASLGTEPHVAKFRHRVPSCRSVESYGSWSSSDASMPGGGPCMFCLGMSCNLDEAARMPGLSGSHVLASGPAMGLLTPNAHHPEIFCHAFK